MIETLTTAGAGGGGPLRRLHHIINHHSTAATINQSIILRLQCPPRPNTNNNHMAKASKANPKAEPQTQNSSSSSSSSSRSPLFPSSLSSSSRHLRRLTSRIVLLTRRKQLRQIFKEVHVARRRHGRRLNTIVMNAVLEACVHCGDADSALRVFEEMAKAGACGVDTITYSTLLKGLGEARRVDEAFEILESVEKGTAPGTPKLSSQLIYGLLNALLEAAYAWSNAGDMRRANGLLARYRMVIHDKGNSLLLYNLLMKGYANTDFPLGALAVRDEITRHGLKPDKLTYNTLVFACVKSGRMDVALGLFAEMKAEATKAGCDNLFPDAVTYTTLFKGLGSTGDLLTIQNLVVEMKSVPIFIDRVAYTTIIDALLACGCDKGALCVFGEMLKRAGEDSDLKPKPHLYLSMMRGFAVKGDFNMVKKLHARMWLDTVGEISVASQRQGDELLMEAAINDNQVHLARQILCKITKRQKWFSWGSRGGMVAIRLETLCGFSSPLFNPYILHEVSLDDPVEKYMTTFRETSPLPATLVLRKAVMRFYRDACVPILDESGNCVGIVHREDCNELDAPLSSMARGPPPCMSTSTSIGRVIDLVLEKRCKMVVVVKSSDDHGTGYNSNYRPVGFFSYEQLFKLAVPVKHESNPPICCK